MKKCLFTVFLLLVPAIISVTFAQQSQFDEANALLEENKFREALEHYRAIAEEGHHSGALWLNMGYAYSQIDSLGMAKYYLLQAERYPETRELADEALNFVNNRFSRRSAVLPALPWDRFFRGLSEGIGVRSLVYTGLLFLYLGVTFLIGSWFRYDLRKIFRYSGVTGLSVSALVMILAIIVYYQDIRYGTGVMVDRQGQVFQHPRAESAVVSTAYEGYTMRVDFKQSEDYPDWKYVRLENGMYGWIKDEQLKIF